MKYQRGFTIFELLFVIMWLAALGMGFYLFSLVVQVLLKFLAM